MDARMPGILWAVLCKGLIVKCCFRWHSSQSLSAVQVAMSLFENDEYEWRETCFVLFDASLRPTAEAVEAALAELGKQFQVSQIVSNDDGLLESMTVFALDDYAAMDVSYVEGDEVAEHIHELSGELTAESSEEKELMARLPDCNARFDVFHFEKRVSSDDDEFFLDPGGLLSILETLATLGDGVRIDPQTGIIV